jgi:hypothetical protein
MNFLLCCNSTTQVGEHLHEKKIASKKVTQKIKERSVVLKRAALEEGRPKLEESQVGSSFNCGWSPPIKPLAHQVIPPLRVKGHHPADLSEDGEEDVILGETYWIEEAVQHYVKQFQKNED